MRDEITNVARSEMVECSYFCTKTILSIEHVARCNSAPTSKLKHCDKCLYSEVCAALQKLNGTCNAYFSEM